MLKNQANLGDRAQFHRRSVNFSENRCGCRSIFFFQLYHPYVIDTSVVYNISGVRQTKAKLSTLALAFLGLTIQTGGKAGHNPAEDSYATMKLVKLKLEKGLQFGDCLLG